MADENLLIFADDEDCADLRYAIGMLPSEPMVYLRLNGRGYALLSDADLKRGRQQARHCRVLSLARYLRSEAGPEDAEPATIATAIQRVALEQGARRLLVPSGFPLGLARDLRRLKIRVKPRGGQLFFPERELKSAAEVEMIRAALVMAEVGMAEAIHALRNSRIGPQDRLVYRGSPLNADKLRSIMQVAVYQARGTPVRVTVTAGRHAATLEESGSIPLLANQPIILSVTPRSNKTGYHGEITRTVVRGRASEVVREMNAALLRAQQAILELVRDGTRAPAVHRTVRYQLAQDGFRLSRDCGPPRGRFIPIGQGIGLELEEPPRLSAGSRVVLRAGHVLSVGPGLCFAETGGVRMTDLLVVTRNGARNLTQFERVLEV